MNGLLKMLLHDIWQRDPLRIWVVSPGSRVVAAHWKKGTLRYLHDWSELSLPKEVNYPRQENQEDEKSNDRRRRS